MKKHIFTGIALAISLGSTGAGAQVVSNSGLVVKTNQSLVGVVVGNGVTQGQTIVNVESQKAPAIGVGALSGNPSHYGTVASLSVLNSARLLGVDGAAGPSRAGSISLNNPNPGPILNPNSHR